jgi:hypothetical protein
MRMLLQTRIGWMGTSSSNQWPNESADWRFPPMIGAAASAAIATPLINDAAGSTLRVQLADCAGHHDRATQTVG